MKETGTRAAPKTRGIADTILSYIFVRRGAPFYARYTLHHHLRAGIFQGIFFGIFMLNIFVARKTLHAADWEISALTSLPMVFFLFSSVWAQFMNDANNSRFIIFAGIFGRLSLLAFFFISSSAGLLVMVVLCYFMHAVFLPAQSRIFQANYSDQLRGRAFSLVQTRIMLASALTAYITGWLLDEVDPHLYKLLFPLAGVFGFWAYYRYTRISMRGGRAPQPAREKSFPFSDFFSILAKDRRFLWYEAFFFLYGIGFMITMPLMYMLAADVLKMPEGQFANAFIVVPQIIMLVLVPVCGRLMDRLNPIRLCAIAFAFLAFWPLVLGYAAESWHVFAAFVFYALGMAPVRLTWSLGALFFAPTREAQKYHSIHLTLVGLRACFVPWLAVLVLKPLIGLRPTLFLAFGFFALSAALMLALHLHLPEPRSNKA